MTWEQVAAPTPEIPCQPGWCLQYVREAFGLPARYDSATEAWENSPSQHPGRDYPDGVWAPVWFAVAGEPLGHVALRAPDGSVYSTSDFTTTPHHHASVTDLEGYYAYYGMPLTYRGWTEDVAGYPVITWAGITAQGTAVAPPPTTEDVLMPDAITDQIMHDKDHNPASVEGVLNKIDGDTSTLLGLFNTPIEDPSDPGKFYTPLTYIVWAATNAKYAAQAGAAAAGPSLGDIASHLTITTKP